jgi:hypothetical protein
MKPTLLSRAESKQLGRLLALGQFPQVQGRAQEVLGELRGSGTSTGGEQA